MVWTSVVRNTAAKRIPLIKFRSQRHEQSQVGASSQQSGSTQITAATSSSSPAAAHILPTIEDWQLPNRYRRKPIDQAEMDYINRGGPA